MRSTWLIASLLVLGVAVPSKAQRSSRDPGSAGDEWLDRCRDSRNNRYNNDRERLCEVREKRLSPSRTLDIDGQQNGSVSVHGWDRSEVYVLAKIQTEGEDAGEARDVASRIEIQAESGHIRADGPSTRRNQSWSVSFEVWAPRQTDIRA